MLRQGRSSAARWHTRLLGCLLSAEGAEGSQVVSDEGGDSGDDYDGIAEAVVVAVPQPC